MASAEAIATMQVKMIEIEGTLKQLLEVMNQYAIDNDRMKTTNTRLIEERTNEIEGKTQETMEAIQVLYDSTNGAITTLAGRVTSLASMGSAGSSGQLPWATDLGNWLWPKTFGQQS